jgi:hypothetical protein
MDCTFGNTKVLTDSLKKITTLFQNAITNSLSEDKTAFDNLNLSKKYVQGIDLIRSQAIDTSSQVNKCIEKYRVLLENTEVPTEESASNIMYSDTKQIVKSNLRDTVWLIFGIVILCFFLYKMKN